MNALELRSVTRHYGRRAVLSGVDLFVAPEETVALTGPNGAGKSTLLRVAAGLLRPTGGTVHVAGQDAWKEPQAVRRHLGAVFQDVAVYDPLTPVEHLRWWARLHGLAFGGEEAVDRLREAGLFLQAHRPAGHLSRGQRQRLGLAMALLPDPDLLLLDEPHTALDAAGAEWLDAMIRERGGATVVVAHEGRAHRLADRVVHLEKGRLEEVHGSAGTGGPKSPAASPEVGP